MNHKLFLLSTIIISSVTASEPPKSSKIVQLQLKEQKPFLKKFNFSQHHTKIAFGIYTGFVLLTMKLYYPTWKKEQKIDKDFIEWRSNYYDYECKDKNILVRPWWCREVEAYNLWIKRQEQKKSRRY